MPQYIVSNFNHTIWNRYKTQTFPCFLSLNADLEGFFGKSILQVPDTGMSQYWSILEHFWCTSIARKMWYLHSLEYASVIQKLTILEHKNGLVLSNTRVPVSGTWSILFLFFQQIQIHHYFSFLDYHQCQKPKQFSEYFPNNLYISKKCNIWFHEIDILNIHIDRQEVQWPGVSSSL